MTTARRRVAWAVAASFLAAFALSIVPLPDWAQAYRPDWVAMTVIFWGISLPGWIGIGAAWACGMLLDTLKGSLLGQHTLALAFMAYLTFKFHQRIRVFPIWQETFAVFLLLSVYHFFLLWVDGIIGNADNTITLTMSHLMTLLSSVIFWPIWVTILNTVARQTR